MNIGLFSGAYKNSGDFLIEDRSKALLEHVFRDAKVDIFKRDASYDDRIDELNEYDLLVFGGGPGFQRDIYPDKIPFISSLDSISTRCAILGWGWKAPDNTGKEIYRKKVFTPDMMNFLKFMCKEGNHISCRDWYTRQMLYNQGIKNVVMTGCPAWYDVDRIYNLDYRGCTVNYTNGIKIIISDAALPKNIKSIERVISITRNIFPEASLTLLLHRGITNENRFLTNADIKSKYGYECEEISGSANGFKQYDECDLHIGFRVHAHIYNLSHGNTTLLINEDARGFGVNDALGLPDIAIDRNLEQSIRCQIDSIIQSDGLRYKVAVEAIKKYYGEMIRYIGSLGQ